MNINELFKRKSATDEDLDLDQPIKKPAKKFDFNQFSASFSQLDPQNLGSWPLAVKVTSCLAVVAGTILMSWLLLVSGLRQQITDTDVEEQRALTDYTDKSAKFKHLTQYQQQFVKMEADFGHLLEQLPKVNEISGLVEDISFTGKGSGVQIENIQVEPEISQELFKELPLTIKAKGDFHAFGSFMSGIAALPRIVTIGNFVVTPEAKVAGKSQVPVLMIEMHAKTYRYNDDVPPKDAETAGATPPAKVGE